MVSAVEGGGTPHLCDPDAMVRAIGGGDTPHHALAVPMMIGVKGGATFDHATPCVCDTNAMVRVVERAPNHAMQCNTQVIPMVGELEGAAIPCHATQRQATSV